MSAKTILHQAMLNEWVVRIAEQKASGLNVSYLCIQNGLTKDKYFYWKRKIKDELITQTLPELYMDKHHMYRKLKSKELLSM